MADLDVLHTTCGRYIVLLRHLPGQCDAHQHHDLSSSLLATVSATVVAGKAGTCGGCRAARAVLEGVGRFACRAPIGATRQNAAAQADSSKLSQPSLRNWVRFLRFIINPSPGWTE